MIVLEDRGEASCTGDEIRLIDSCITQLEAQGPSRTCNKSKEEETKQRNNGVLSAVVQERRWLGLISPYTR